MTCEGCSGAVERVLNRLKGQGVDSVDISLPEQKVSVTSTLSADQLLEYLVALNVGEMGEVGGEVALIADELSRAVELTLNAAVAHEARNQAYNACESFKESSPWCAQAGLLLASGQYSAVVKHFGLQLMEHTVKYRWTQITQAEKIFIKENAMKLLYIGGWETGHLNDALARVIVEMIKREWPQQWPTLLAELSDACAQGHVHTQIVLHVFLRLVEDVATLQTLEQHQRRKDIYQALTSNMSEIFAFFMRLIELHVVLLTLTGFVEWVSTNHVVMNNGRLLQILCVLLQDAAFQLPAADEDAISCIHRAAVASISAVDENNYLFLKKLSQQLTTLWNFATNVDFWMPVLLETMLLLTSHPSLTLAHTTSGVWLAMFRHDHISKLPQVVAIIPRWLQAAAPKVLKVTYPASRASGVHDAATYACIDYDSEQEFAVFFSRCRTEILDCFRHCMTAAPLVTWAYVEQWTRSALDKVDTCPVQLDVTHPLHVEWEALSQVLDVVLSRLLQAEPRPSVVEGLQLLQRCVGCAPAAPLLLSLLLSLISALFVFLSCAYSQLAGPSVGGAGAELLPRVLDKIFAALVYCGTGADARRSRAVKNVRRHAASLLVKLGSKYPLLLLPVFGRLHELCQAALARPGLSAVESVTIQEALLLVLGDCSARWAALGPHVSSAAALARLGLIHAAHARALTPPPAERRNLLGLCESDAPPPQPQDRMQTFLHTLHDNVCHLVGAAATTLGRELYSAPGLARALAGSLLHALPALPEHWLRPVVRHALKPLLLHCPPAHYQDVALPLLDVHAPFMLVHLSQRWDYIVSLYESGKLEEEGSNESQEVLEDMLVRHLTREHLEVLKDSPPPVSTQRAPEHVSELGALVLARPHAGPAVLHTVLRALTWQDSTSSLRATALALPALRAALEAGLVGEAEASGALAAVLQALRAHGQHDANQCALLALAVQLFKKEVYILDLPTMPAPARDKPRSALDAPDGAGLPGLFAPAPT
ncbi:hypothetical protein MSG28_001771 [Choristoneura fumiferana]|uniref:Uncharacterized protein n=1 Tax=Choristoneura fumiferana TaxID=7141 RepID=A0ACC0KVC7_CHOFU|nr:hypothetical protein MSG28_001771 [Choristoneura fumiferana]